MLLVVAMARGASRAADDLERRFERETRPFVERYCLSCHDAEMRKAELDLSRYATIASVVESEGHWGLVLERLRNRDMPPKKAKDHPSDLERNRIIAWIEALRGREARRRAGDPGPMMARRLSNAEYDYTIRDLTGVDLRPARTFPVDPANQAGFDNSAESLSLSPVLVQKHLQAARAIADHLALQPGGFTFAPHPVVADTDRDKWAVFRIVDFYRRQPTDLADYFQAAWKFQHRSMPRRKTATLEAIAAESKVSAKYLAMVWSILTETREVIGPIAKLQTMWRSLPPPGSGADPGVRHACESMRDYVIHTRQSIVPEVKNLTAPPIQNGSQTLVLWKNRQMAANRRRFDPAALQSSGSSPRDNGAAAASATATSIATAATNVPPRRRNARVQAETPDYVKKGGFSLAPTVVTKESSATAHMAAAKKRSQDPESFVPESASERARYEAAFARFANVFPDAFYITERARVYLDAEKEQENAGRLLSAGLHSMTGYFRDDQPLYDLVLDENGRKELDRLWDDFDFIAAVPQRMHTSFVWFERTDSAFMRDPEFDPYRPEDKSVVTQPKIDALAALYLAKARRNNASDLAQRAIHEHFSIVASNVFRVEQLRAAAEPAHLLALEKFAARAYRRPLAPAERQDVRAMYQTCRNANGADHETAIRDSVVGILMSPHFLFRMDLIEAAGPAVAPMASNSNQAAQSGPMAMLPLSDQALASRLSYFLWSSMPDEALLRRAAAGELRRPSVLRGEVRRLLADERAWNFAVEFAGNWLDVRRFEELNSVDRERFPAFDHELRNAMFEEPLRFFLDVARRDRSVLDFLYARDTFVNDSLARHYGLPAGIGDSNRWVQVEDARSFGRGGLLPMGAFLTANSPGLRTSPVKRGYWVARRLLGERIPPPPAIVPELPKDEKAMGAVTLRQALELHRTREGCMECHVRFDSFGLVFESFGPVGERRSVDLGGRAVDTRAEFPGGSQGEGLGGLLHYIRAHRQDEFVDNLCRKMLAYALGRTLILSDDPLVAECRAKLKSNGYRFKSLAESIVLSSQFLNTRNDDAVVSGLEFSRWP